MAGSLSKKGENKWQLRVSRGYDSNGKQRRLTKTVFAKTKKDAEKQLAMFYLEVTGRLATNKDIKFSEFVEYWKQRHSKRTSPITMQRYQQMLDGRILPEFGNKKLSKITDEHILRFMSDLESINKRLDQRNENGLSSVTIEKHFRLLHLLFNKACEWKYLTNNPCKEIPKDMLPKAESEHYPIWNKSELSRFLTILEDMPYTLSSIRNKLIFYIALTTGARRGEILGLTWDCINLEAKTIKIEKAMKYVVGMKPFLDKPKTKASRRILYFDDFTQKLFQRYEKELKEHFKINHIRNADNLVFVSTKTENNETLPLDGKAFYLWLSRMCEKYDLPRIAVHSIRAMAATYALTSGMPLNMVQTMLGHTNISTTSIYLHDVYDQRKIESEKYTKALEEMRKIN